jgi:hypothetical protein
MITEGLLVQAEYDRRMSYREIVENALVCFAKPCRRDAYFDLYSQDVVLHGYVGDHLKT